MARAFAHGAAPPVMLRVAHVTKRYGSLVALDDLSLEIAAGEFFGLLGPNGAGKSTLMSLLSGFRAADAGEIALGGARFRPDDLAARAQLGLVPQHVALYLELSAEENLRIFGRLAGLSGAKLAARIDAALVAVQLADRRRDRVKTFSGGMQRRLNLAAAILHEPKLLLCDEPTVGVDPQSRNAIFDLLEQLNRAGTTVIYSTHYMEEAERLCSRIGVIDHGQILALGTLDELLARLPAGDDVRFPRELAHATPALRETAARFGTLREDGDDLHLAPAVGFKLSQFFAATEELGLPARHFTLTRPSLEDVFLHLTGRTLRDG